MIALVTGAAGFLGTECVGELRAAGHTVITTDQHGTVDIELDLADALAVRRLPDVDTVVHSAAVQYVSDDLPVVRRRAYFLRNNVEATRNLVRRYSDGRTHFVNVGTSMMYEQTGRSAYGIDAPMRPQGLYTSSKIESQRLVDAMSNPWACVIPCIIAGGRRGGLFEPLVRTIARWHVAICPGRGDHPVHLVHVTDAARLIAAVVASRAVGRFNAASPEPQTLTEWMRDIADELRVAHMRIVRLPYSPIAALSAISGYRLLAREQILMLRYPHVLATDESLALGWAPAYTNAAIVRETARAIAKRLRV
jgi:nucleoside-diphosphate-sugar epimerase